MRKTMKKMLAASTLCIIMSGSFISGSARVLAEKYYGFNDGTGEHSPFPVYVTPITKPNRNTAKVVYCFNKDMKWPETWDKAAPKNQIIYLYTTIWKVLINYSVHMQVDNLLLMSVKS
ncbi:Cys-Gln thioester bond-forming surface protein [Streptococcus equi]|uniref:Cys-Gln thioester bond-forming surface protein n=1 Tax=Streptococcus equi TaxID=1336 RepID=UPI000A44516E|nr:Cys-Gln thioester bond-forming surface protein [Streptococcus equi]